MLFGRSSFWEEEREEIGTVKRGDIDKKNIDFYSLLNHALKYDNQN